MSDDIVATLRRESFYRPTSRINSFGRPQMGFELTSFNLIAADEIERLRSERDEARRRTNSILTEIDCRIEHGAESNGHLEVLRDMFKEKTDE